jgi:RNA polymerase sigma-70 factor, ECF subfamily
MGFSAAEIASQLSTTTPAVTSALQRARARVQRSLPQRSQQETLQALGDAKIQATVRRYTDALERGDADTLIGMLTRDATWSMPPIPTWFAGHERIREFLVRWPLTDQWQHFPVRANGQLAVACYIYDHDEGRFVPAVIDVLTMAGDKISAITAFMTPDIFDRVAAASELSGAELFDRFGVPAPAA